MTAQMNMIEIQDAYIARITLAHSKITARTKGNRFNKTRNAARKEAAARLVRLGYAEDAATQIIKDAHDMFTLEISAD